MDGIDRLFLVHVPAGHDRARPAPVVLAFHGTSSDAEEMRRITGFDRTAGTFGFVAVYPQAAFGDWATGCVACPSAADHARIDDPAFVRRLVDRLAAELPVDRRRVFAVGFSNGALFADRLACESDGIVAGSAIVGATLLDEAFTPPCRPAGSVPILLVHGDADPVFPPQGRAFGADPAAPRTISIGRTFETWAARNRCAAPSPPEPVPDRIDDGTRVTFSRYTGCRLDAEVALYAVEGGGHTWPGSPVPFDRSLGPKSLDLDASVAIARFFLER